MNLFAFLMLAVTEAPIMLFVIFWGLLFFWLVGIFAWRESTWWPSYNGIVLIVLFAILGYVCLGNPLSR